MPAVGKSPVEGVDVHLAGDAVRRGGGTGEFLGFASI